VHHPEDFTTPLDKVVYGTLADPITPDYVRDVNTRRKGEQSSKRQSESRRWAKS
jgi:hypothetical protein